MRSECVFCIPVSSTSVPDTGPVSLVTPPVRARNYQTILQTGMSLQKDKGDKSEPEEMESDFSLSESEDDDEEDDDVEVKEGETAQDAPADNSSDDEDAERCPICLLR